MLTGSRLSVAARQSPGDRDDLGRVGEGGGEAAGDGVVVALGDHEHQAGLGGEGEAGVGGGGHEVEVDADGAGDHHGTAIGVGADGDATAPTSFTLSRRHGAARPGASSVSADQRRVGHDRATAASRSGASRLSGCGLGVVAAPGARRCRPPRPAPSAVGRLPWTMAKASRSWRPTPTSTRATPVVVDLRPGRPRGRGPRRGSSRARRRPRRRRRAAARSARGRRPAARRAPGTARPRPATRARRRRPATRAGGPAKAAARRASTTGGARRRRRRTWSSVDALHGRPRPGRAPSPRSGRSSSRTQPDDPARTVAPPGNVPGRSSTSSADGIDAQVVGDQDARSLAASDRERCSGSRETAGPCAGRLTDVRLLAALAVPRSKRSMRPPVSTSFCLPV